MNSLEKPPQQPIDRLKVLINSSTPIIVMETVEEVRAVSLARTACSQLSLAVFEWTIADGERLREIIRETYTRMAGTHTLKFQLDSNGVDAMAANLRGLTEEAAERAISQTVVGRLALSPECITDVLDAKKALLKRSEMLEFVDSTDTMSSVGGLDNLKRWLEQRRGAWDDGALKFGLEPPKGAYILGVHSYAKTLSP